MLDLYCITYFSVPIFSCFHLLPSAYSTIHPVLPNTKLKISNPSPNGLSISVDCLCTRSHGLPVFCSRVVSDPESKPRIDDRAASAGSDRPHHSRVGGKLGPPHNPPPTARIDVGSGDGSDLFLILLLVFVFVFLILLLDEGSLVR